MALPPEVWSHVFGYLDGVSLMNARSVSDNWQDIVDSMLKKGNYWYRQCVLNVPREFWRIFFEKWDPDIQIDQISTNDSRKWMGLHKSWYFAKNVQNCITTEGQFNPLPKQPARQEITCMETLKNIMVVGSSNGYVYVYDLDRLGDDDPMFTADCVEFVKNVRIVKNVDQMWLVSCSINDTVKCWDLGSKTLVKEMRGRLICSNYYHLCVASGRGFYVESENPEIHNSGESIVLIALFDKDMVTIYTEAGSYAKYSLANPQVRYSTTILKVPENVRKLYAFKPEIIVYVTAYGSIGFAVEGKEWHKYDLGVFNGSIPTNVCIYGQLLILGLDNGFIHMYYFEDLGKLDFSPSNSKTIFLNSEAIIHMEIFFHEEEQYLAVCQSKTVHVVQFLEVKPIVIRLRNSSSKES